MFRECIFPVSRSEELVCGVGCSEPFFPGCFGGPRTSQDVPRVSHVHSLRLLAFQQRLCARCRLIHSWRPVVGALATTTNRRSMRSLPPHWDRSDGRRERQEKRRSSTVDPIASWIDTQVATGGGRHGPHKQGGARETWVKSPQADFPTHRRKLSPSLWLDCRTCSSDPRGGQSCAHIQRSNDNHRGAF